MTDASAPLQAGILDLLILKTLTMGELHGFGIVFLEARLRVGA